MVKGRLVKLQLWDTAGQDGNQRWVHGMTSWPFKLLGNFGVMRFCMEICQGTLGGVFFFFGVKMGGWFEHVG